MQYPMTYTRGWVEADFFALRNEELQHVLTCLLAAPAVFRTDAAMLVVGGVPLALLRTGTACLQTALNHGAGQIPVELGLPAENLSGGDTHVGAVQTQTDAADHRRHVVLGEVGIRARGAALRAVEASVDACNQHLRLDRGSSGVRLEDLSGVSHDVLLPREGPTVALLPAVVKPANAS
jgi:hypothetical protein